MKYMGSKNRHAKDIIGLITKNRKPDQWYVEPFCGGCNVIDKVHIGNRMANDSHYYLISMWKALVNESWLPPKTISEEEYSQLAIKARMDVRDDQSALIGYVGFNSYGGKWFGGYRRDSIGLRDYSLEHYKNIMKQLPLMKGVSFFNLDYRELDIPKNSIVYCDPPYDNSTEYKHKFNHDEFWEWIRTLYMDGHTVYVSEYNAPADFESVWQKEVNNTLVKNTGSKKGIEKLFVLRDTKLKEGFEELLEVEVA